ncbi:hypothetical protein [Mycolicibacter minnesotensis]
MNDSEPLSRKRLLTLLAFGAVAVVLVAGIAWATRAQPIRQLVPLPSAEAIGPGIGIKISYADSKETNSCTAGFLVRTKDGQPALLSAGYCNKPGGPSTVSIRRGGIYPKVGKYTETIYGGDGWDDVNIGLIALNHTDKIPLVPTIDGRPVTGVAESVSVGTTLCHFGVRSDEPLCGPVAASNKDKVRFNAGGTCGDSGGPVYRVNPDGTAEAVGILTSVSTGGNPDTTCRESLVYSVAQLVKPWLDKWDLTLVTAQT